MAIKNFAYSLVATAPSPADSGTTLTVSSGDGTKFAVGNAVVWPPSVQPTVANAEIVTITGVSTDTLTITRTQESSTNQSILVGWQIDQGVTAALIATLVTLTDTQTLTNKTLTAPTLTSPLEGAYITGTAPTATQAVYVTTNGTYILNTASAANNWIFNVASTSGASLNSLLAVGQSVTVTYLVTQGTTAYYCTAIDIDGAAQTVNWQGGSAPSAGNASGIDAYTITIVKTASAVYTVLAALTKF